LALGLPAFLAPSAYSLCENVLPSIKARGVLKGKQIVGDLVKRIETKFMAKNKPGNRNMSQHGVLTSGKAKQPQIAGMGRTTAPVAVSRPIRKNSKPKMSLSGDAMVIRHSEMIGSILSGAPTSNVTALELFPSVPTPASLPCSLGCPPSQLIMKNTGLNTCGS
jgi:hypothetical protein